MVTQVILRASDYSKELLLKRHACTDRGVTLDYYRDNTKIMSYHLPECQIKDLLNGLATLYGTEELLRILKDDN